MNKDHTQIKGKYRRHMREKKNEIEDMAEKANKLTTITSFEMHILSPVTYVVRAKTNISNALLFFCFK